MEWIYKKGQCTKNVFQVFTCLSNMFTHYMEKLEIYNAFIISEPEFTVWPLILKLSFSKAKQKRFEPKFKVVGKNCMQF